MMWPRRLRPVMSVLVAVVLGACAETQLAVYTAKKAVRQVTGPEVSRRLPKKTGEYKIGSPYQIAGVWYYPREDPDYDETGIASWYGPQFHGRYTANGEVFDMYDLTAAHRTLPLPSRVRVTNLENGRSLIVRVNDRGPFARGRIIDLSRRAAQLLGFERRGTARVRVQIVSDGRVAGSPAGNPALPKPITTEEERTAVVAAPRIAVSAAPLPPPPGIDQAPAHGARSATARTVATAGAVDGAVLPPPEPVVAPALESGVLSIVPVKPTRLYVQAGAFVEFTRANRLRAKLYGIGRPRVTSASIDGKEYFRVRIGPLATVEEADRILAQVLARGERAARIVVVE